MWDTWTDIKYGGGVLSNNLTVVDQTVLYSTGGSNKIGLYYSTATSSNRKKYKLFIRYYCPATYHSSQTATATFVNGSYTGSTTTKSTSAIVIYSTAYSSSDLSSRIKSGTITFTMPSYYDTTSNTYYTGVQYTCNFSELSTSIKYFGVTYQ